MIDQAGISHRTEEGEAVYLDTVLGVAGQTYPIGTKQLPSSNLADALALMTQRNSKVLVLMSDLVLTATLDGITVKAMMPGITDLDFSGEEIDNCTFIGLKLGGGQAATAAKQCIYIDCVFDGVGGGINNLWGILRNCVFYGGSYVLKDNTDTYFYDCSFAYTTIDWGEADTCVMTHCHVTYDDYPYIGGYSGAAATYAALDLHGGAVEVYAKATDSVYLFGDFILMPKCCLGSGEIEDHRINRLIDLGASPITLTEWWVTEAIDLTLWTPTDPATGTAWGCIARGGVIVARTAPNLNETARLISTVRMPVIPGAAEDDVSITEFMVIEFELEIDSPANIDNTLFFIGLTTGLADNRGSADIIGVCLTSDQLYALIDDGGVEYTAVISTTPGTRHKVRIEIGPQSVRWFLDDFQQAATTARIPSDIARYFNIFIDTEAGGSAQFYIGPIDIRYTRQQFTP